VRQICRKLVYAVYVTVSLSNISQWLNVHRNLCYLFNTHDLLINQLSSLTTTIMLTAMFKEPVHLHLQQKQHTWDHLTNNQTENDQLRCQLWSVSNKTLNADKYEQPKQYTSITHHKHFKTISHIGIDTEAPWLVWLILNILYVTYLTLNQKTTIMYGTK